MERDQLDDDTILAGDDLSVTSYDEDDAILGETETAEPEPQPEPAAEPETQTDVQPAVTQPQDDRQAYAWAAMNEKLKQAQAEAEQLRRDREQAQQQVDAGLLGDEELGYINQQLSERDAYWQSQLTTVQRDTSLRDASRYAEMHREQTGGWDNVLKLAEQEGARDCAKYGWDQQAFFDTIRNSPDAGERIFNLANQAQERATAQQPVDWDKKLAEAETKAYQKAMTDLQARQAASPHNLAPPGIGAIPSVRVTPDKVMTDDEILALD